MLDNTNPLCITSTNHEVLLTNRAYRDRWPMTETTGGPVSCFDTRPGSLCRTGGCPLELILAGAPVAVCESEKDLPDGTRKNFIVTARPFRDEEGTLVGIVENFQDITDRKEAEDALAAEKERLSVTLRSIGDGVITADTEGRVVLLNKVAEHLTGWTAGRGRRPAARGGLLHRRGQERGATRRARCGRSSPPAASSTSRRTRR